MAPYPEGPGRVVDSLLCDGVIISGATVTRSVLAPDVRVEAGAWVEDSVLMEGVHVGPGATVHRAIIDKHVHVPTGIHIDRNYRADEERFAVTESGIAVLGRGHEVDSGGS